jgi:hypothetical protein
VEVRIDPTSNAKIGKHYPPTQKATVFENVDECVEGTPRSSDEPSGVCFGGFRPTKHVEEPRASARGAPLPQTFTSRKFKKGVCYNPYFTITKESIIEKTYSSENLPQPLSVSSRTDFAKEGEFLPFARCASACAASKGREGGI